MGRRTFSIKHKLELIKEFKEAREEGESIAGLADQYSLDRKTIWRWLANKEKYKEAKKRRWDKYILAKSEFWPTMESKMT